MAGESAGTGGNPIIPIILAGGSVDDRVDAENRRIFNELGVGLTPQQLEERRKAAEPDRELYRVELAYYIAANYPEYRGPLRPPDVPLAQPPPPPPGPAPVPPSPSFVPLPPILGGGYGVPEYDELPEYQYDYPEMGTPEWEDWSITDEGSEIIYGVSPDDAGLLMTAPKPAPVPRVPKPRPPARPSRRLPRTPRRPRVPKIPEPKYPRVPRVPIGLPTMIGAEIIRKGIEWASDQVDKAWEAARESGERAERAARALAKRERELAAEARRAARTIPRVPEPRPIPAGEIGAIAVPELGPAVETRQSPVISRAPAPAPAPLPRSIPAPKPVPAPGPGRPLPWLKYLVPPLLSPFLSPSPSPRALPIGDPLPVPVPNPQPYPPPLTGLNPGSLPSPQPEVATEKCYTVCRSTRPNRNRKRKRKKRCKC